MQPCAAYLERLSAFYDGELAPALADEVAAHLEGCAACGERLAEIARLEQAARCPEPPPVAAEEWARCWAGIAAALDEQMPSEIVLQAGERAARLARRLIPIAASLLLALAAYGYFVHASHEREEDVLSTQRAFIGAAFAAVPGGL